LKADLNRLSPRMDWQVAGLGVIHGWLMAEQAPEDVSVEVVLENWGCVIAASTQRTHRISRGRSPRWYPTS
jgi:hypothetical protein